MFGVGGILLRYLSAYDFWPTIIEIFWFYGQSMVRIESIMFSLDSQDLKICIRKRSVDHRITVNLENFAPSTKNSLYCQIKSWISLGLRCSILYNPFRLKIIFLQYFTDLRLYHLPSRMASGETPLLHCIAQIEALSLCIP